MKLFSIPNILTLGNLACGCLAIVFAFQGNLFLVACLVGIAAVLDFLDGFVARALKQFSPIGKDLDSLADMVTFGVVPGIVMFCLISVGANYTDVFHTREYFAAHNELLPKVGNVSNLWNSSEYVGCQILRSTSPFAVGIPLMAWIAFIIPLFSALRLAKFNNDTRQSDAFMGVPTPANAILICSLPLVLNIGSNSPHAPGIPFDLPEWQQFILNPWFLVCLSLLMSFLLIAELPLFALKFKSMKWKGNEIRFSFITLCLIGLITLKFVALPLSIVLYIAISVVSNLFSSEKK